MSKRALIRGATFVIGKDVLFFSINFPGLLPADKRHFLQKIPFYKMPVDISHFGCYPHSITNAMTQSSKQGDALREVPGGARHSAIQLPNWLYSGCVEPPVNADGRSRYSAGI